MPMRRLEIRNEYGIGDPELYRVADKDDPEALLEGVAMSALVGLLRQLGDLSQFAAEIFHDLHEEVMATAARGHGLTARLQQLEVEFPFVEKACLSRTNHSPFFTNLGVDWHTNSRVEQNLVTRGDLPRFVMDSYEECRGPPRLFLLDKFDVAGAGACLKRYTDPSFFKVDAVSSEIPTADVQRERKVRKSKRKVSRWRNGETPEVAPASHAKLHELFLEERVENGHSHPARVVKLKRRQLNGSPFVVTSGKSYMEKFVGTPSPENKMVCADSVTSPLKLTWDDSSEAGVELHEVGVVSPVEKSKQGKETTIPLGNELMLLKSYIDEDNESNGETVDRAIVDVPGPMTEASTDESLFSSLKTRVEEESALDGDAKIESIFNGVLSDDMNSEIDNYTDALTTMESEMETDNDYKNDQVLLNVEKCGMDSDAIQQNLEVQSKFSGSQSMLNTSLSCDGDSTAQIGQSNSPSSDCLCNSAENLPSDGEEIAELSPSFENHEAEIVDLPTDCQHMLLKARGTESGNLVAFSDRGINEDMIHTSLDVPSSSYPADSKDVVAPLVPVGNAPCEIPSGCVSLDSRLFITSRSGMDLADSSVVTSDVQDFAFSEGHPMQKRNQELTVSSDSLTYSSLLVESGFKSKCGGESASEVQEVHEEILVKGNIGLPQSSISPLEVQLPCPDSQADLGVTFSPCSSDVVRLDYLDNAINPPIIVSGANLGLEPRLNASEDHISEECDGTDATIHLAQVELESPEEFGNLDSEEEGNLVENSGSMYSKEIREVSRQVDERVRDVAPSAGEEDSTVPSHAVDSEKYGESSSNLVVGDAMAFERPSNTLVECKFYPNDEANELPQVGDASKCVPVSTDADDETRNVVWSSSDVLPVSIDHIDQDSLSGLKFQHEETFSSEPIAELKALEEVNREVEVLDNLGSTSYKSADDGDHSRPNVDELVPESFLTAQTRESLHCSEDTDASVTAVSNSDLKLENCKIGYTETGCNVLGSPLINVAPTESSSELPLQLQAHAAEQLTAKDMHTGIGGASSESVNSGESGSCHQLLEFQIEQIVVPSLNTSEQSPELLNLQSEQIEVPSHIDEVTCLDGSVGSVLEVLRSQESVETKPTSIPFSSVFPSPGTQAEPTCINLEEMPPLPPLPPMQWRMGKVPSAPLALARECSDRSQDISSLTQPAPLVVFPSSDKDILQSSLAESHGVLDSQRLQDASPESLANSCQPTLLQPSGEVRTIVENGFGEEVQCPLEEAQCSNQSMTLPEVSNDREEHGVLDLVEEKQPDTTPFFVAQVSDLEPTFLVRDPVPSENLRSSPKAGVEIQKSQDIVGEDEELTLPGNSAELPTHLEHQHQDELVNVQQETLWSPNTLALPSTYGFTRSNVNKLPLPRNPLIDAVAAHDKSKLRKVAEHVQSQIVPKLEERDSLLEQIRAKSFNLKPAKMARPSIQGMQGPKTNLKVAAILEKANAIRQALAGSDEDDDSDNWSDS